MIEAACAAGARGLVSVGLAPGLVRPAERDAYRRAVSRGVAVAQTSRALHGHIPDRQYLRDARIIPGGSLTPSKCRTLLMVGLVQGMRHETLRGLFSAY